MITPEMVELANPAFGIPVICVPVIVGAVTRSTTTAPVFGEEVIFPLPPAVTDETAPPPLQETVMMWLLPSSARHRPGVRLDITTTPVAGTVSDPTHVCGLDD